MNPCLIAVYLRGGADALSVVAPYADPNYRRLRPSLALSGPDGTDESARVLPLDYQFGFNPHLKHLHALYEAGTCAPIVAVGSPDPTRSHFDAQDYMERGAPGQKSVATGWLNRYLQATRTSRDANLRAASLQPLLPRSVRGAYPVLAKPAQDAEQAMSAYAQMYLNQEKRGGGSAGMAAKQAIQALGARSIEQLHELNTILAAKVPTTVDYPQTGMGRQFRDIAKLLKSRCGLEITALDYGGWDHHVQEGPLDGQMARQLTDVDDSIGAFVEDLGPDLFQHVLILVMSEFGRKVQENDNRGTDHGHGGFMFAIGGKVRGRQVFGKWTGLEDKQLHDGRDLPVHTDFRAVFAESLQGMFGFDGFARELFPGYAPVPAPLNFLQS